MKSPRLSGSTNDNMLALGRSRGRCSTFFAAAVAMGLAASVAFAQGPYYPVTASSGGTPYGGYGATYTNSPISAQTQLGYIQGRLQQINPNYSLLTPLPTGKISPPASDYAAAVGFVAQQVISGGAPFSLTSLADAAVAFRPTDRAVVATALSQSIIASSASSAAAISNLSAVAQSLAISQSSRIDTIIPSLLGPAAANVSVALGIPQIVQSAISQIADDGGRVGLVVGGGLTALSSSGLNQAQRTALVTDPTTGYIKAVLSATPVDGQALLIDVIVKNLTAGGNLGLVSPSGGSSSLELILDAAVSALPTKTDATLGAVAAGALRSQGGSATAIAARLASANAATAAYTNAVITGYSSATLAAYQTAVTGNSNADAAATGALVRGTLTTAQIVQNALTLGTAPARDVVAASVSASPAAALSIVQSSIVSNAPLAGTFADIAGGAVRSAPIDSAGQLVAEVVKRTSSTVTTLPVAAVTSIVDSAITEAAGANKSGAFADIVFSAETVARNTAGISDDLVVQAINSISAATAANIPTPADRPTYIAVVAALAGDQFGTNRASIRSAALTPVTGAIATTGGDLVAATRGADLVQDIQLNSLKKYSKTLTAFNTASGSTNSVLADLYAASLANPTASSSVLAAAVKLSSVAPATLLQAAINSNRDAQDTLEVVRDVAVHAKGSGAGANDVLDYVGTQIVLNPGLTKDIATAYVVVDPGQAHRVAHSVGFNNPQDAYASVPAIFEYAQLASPSAFTINRGVAGVDNIIQDSPAAAAAITAALTSGIIETNTSPTSNTNAPADVATRTALIKAVSAAVAASIAQDGTNLSTNVNFRQSDGGVGTIRTTGSVNRSVGAAGAITGFVAQVVSAGDTSITKPGDAPFTNTTLDAALPTTAAVLRAAAAGGARPYALEIAQAAAQALRWVAGGSVNAAQAAADIANAIAPSVVGFATYTQLFNAATFGINEAIANRLGAGARGLSANANGAVLITTDPTGAVTGPNAGDAYRHRSATGEPVTDIFNL